MADQPMDNKVKFDQNFARSRHLKPTLLSKTIPAIMGNTSQRAQSKEKSHDNTQVESSTSSLGSKLADIALSGQSETLEGASSSDANKKNSNPLKKSLVFSIEEGHVFGDGLELDSLPMELWDLILSFCDDATTSIIIPRICKVLYNVTSADSVFWKAKSKAKKLETDKPDTQTWKRFYFSDNIKLFPLLGFEIGKATYAELLKAEGATANSSGQSRYVTIQKHNFWVESAEPGKFTFMYIVRNIYPLPEHWEAQGFAWSKSFNEYRALFKRWPGNYIVTEVPHKKEFMNKMCFTARISSIAKDNGMLYQLDMQFGYTEGDVDTAGTLYSISITSANAYNGGTSQSYEPRYLKKIIKEAPEKGEYYA